MKEQLSKRGELEEVGGPFYMTQLSSKVASSAPVSYTHLHLSPVMRVAAGNYKAVVAALLEGAGLNYGALPKGLLKFHK